MWKKRTAINHISFQVSLMLSLPEFVAPMKDENNIAKKYQLMVYYADSLFEEELYKRAEVFIEELHFVILVGTVWKGRWKDWSLQYNKDHTRPFLFHFVFALCLSIDFKEDVSSLWKSKNTYFIKFYCFLLFCMVDWNLVDVFVYVYLKFVMHVISRCWFEFSHSYVFRNLNS